VSESNGPRRILIVDDHPAMRQGLALLLSRRGFHVAGEAERKQEALELAISERPDLAVVDLSLKSESGIDLITELRDIGVPSLVYSMHEEPHYIKRAFAAGARGYATKGEVSRVLAEAIDKVIAGERYVSPQAAQAFADKTLFSPGNGQIKQLSPQEEAVLHMLGKGEDTARIAAKLNVNVRTVHSYYNRINVKLGLSGMKELRRLAIGTR
jgi:DNA-binding NarL/FixJ family response regulator